MKTKIDWASKLSSRKFWAMVSGLIVSVAVIIGANNSDVQIITGVITAISDIVIYILAEAYVDAKKCE